MADINWLPVTASLIGGGAMGATITTVATNIRNRKQPIGYKYEILPIFKGTMLGSSNVTAQLFLHSPEHGFGENVPNLSVVILEVSNDGNRDFSTFQFGLTLADGDKSIACGIQTEDRHHQAELLTPIGPGIPSTNIDLKLSPFNRKDFYILTLYLVCTDTNDSPGEIALSSKEPVIFRKGGRKPAITIDLAETIIKASLSRM